MNKTIQLRVRLNAETARPFLLLPPKARSRALSLLVSSSTLGVDLKELITFRSELASLGNLVNQSLRSSWGEHVDRASIEKIVLKLRRLLS
jgi:hypothetical protein